MVIPHTYYPTYRSEDQVLHCHSEGGAPVPQPPHLPHATTGQPGGPCGGGQPAGHERRQDGDRESVRSVFSCHFFLLSFFLSQKHLIRTFLIFSTKYLSDMYPCKSMEIDTYSLCHFCKIVDHGC